MNKERIVFISKIFAIIGVIASIIFGINSWKIRGESSLSLTNQDSLVTIGVKNNENSDVIIGDNNRIDKRTQNYYGAKEDQLNSSNLIGIWNTTESWTKLIFRMLINSEIHFHKDKTFTCSVKFKTSGINYFKAQYRGKWELEDDLLLISEVFLDSLQNYDEAGQNESLSLMVLKEYLDIDKGVKLETIESLSNNTIKTEWKKDNNYIEKLYNRK